MINCMHMFLCGSKSLGQQDKNGSQVSSDKRLKRRKRVSNSNKKNPYADGGVDKFLALVADVDEKKQKIYDEMGYEDISLIRFVYSDDDSERVRPIIVRANNNKTKMLHIIKADEEKKEVYVKPQEELELRVRRNNINVKGSFRVRRHPAIYYHLFVMLVFVLVLLAIYGRSLAILCTSVAWYLVPRFIGRSSLMGKSQ